MELFKTQFDRVRQQLAGLTPSQKMLSASLVVIMVMTLAWWSRFAGQPEWEPVLDQGFSAEEQARVQMQLTATGIEFKPGPDGKLLVPADKKLSAVAAMAIAQVTPKNITSGFDEMIKQLTAWDGKDRQSAIFNRGKELSLERVIAAMPGVVSATVLINPHYDRIIGRNIEPTASASVTLKDPNAKPDKKLAQGIANLISGAQAGLLPSKVQIVMNGYPIAIKDPSSTTGGIVGDVIQELQLAAESSLVQKIEHLFPQIEGLRVSVTFQVNNASESSREESFDKNKSHSELQEQETREREDIVPGGPVANEPAAVTNIGAATAGGQPQPGRSNNDSIEKLKNVVGLGRKETTVQTPAGKPTPIGASIQVPRSYFVRAARQRDPSKKEPDAAAIEKCMADEIALIESAVKSLTQLTAATAITVAPYTDLVPEARDAPVVVAAGMTGLLGGHVKEIALGGLALVSLFMMTMIVRKGAPVPVAIAAATAPAAVLPVPARLDGIEAPAGEATGGDPALDGMELDEDSIKTQQMLGQVTDMVGESPEAAAALIKRWLNQR